MGKPIEEYFLWKLFVKLNRSLLLLCSIIAVGTIVTSVVLRYVFKSDLYGLEEIITLATMWLYFMGGVDGSYEDVHIDADVLSLVIKSKKAKRALRIFVKGVCLAVSVVFAKWGIDYLKWSISVGGVTQTLRMPILLSRMPLSIAFILMVFFNLYHFINALLGRTPPKPGEARPVEKEGTNT